MKIFVSSLIAGFEDYRAAAVAAIRSLGHDPITAETFGASASSPRVACLQGVRDADLVILLLGESYGAVQAVSDLSATHEEYHEAKEHRPVLAFVQEGVAAEPAQREFIQEVQNWSGGLFRESFRTPEDLRDAVTRAIHRFELSSAVTPVDPAEMLARAMEMMPRENRNYVRRGGPILHLAIVGGPAQTILRPVEIEQQAFARTLLRDATYGESPVFDPAHGANQNVVNGTLELTQETGAAVIIDERGSVRISVPIEGGVGMLGAIIEENVLAAIDAALSHGAGILSKVDETDRLSRLVITATIDANGAMGWRTRGEDAASPNSMTMSGFLDRGAREPVHFQPPDRARAALQFDRERLAADLLTLLRRQWR